MRGKLRQSAFPKVFTQFRAHFRKEFHLQTSTFTSLLGKLVVGPVINLLLTGLIYHGVFRSHPNIVLAGLTGESYLSFICMGFLLQNCLGSGYHGFSNRLVSEWSNKTLSLIWLAPSRRIVSFLSLNVVEYCRLGMIFLILLSGGLFSLPHQLMSIFSMLLWFAVLLGMGLMLGFLRACVQILDRGYIDLMDHVYVVAIFASCPYIPLGLLPAPFQVVCLANPLFHFFELGKKIGTNLPVSWLDLALGTLCPLLVFGGVSAFWQLLRVPLRDKSFG